MFATVKKQRETVLEPVLPLHNELFFRYDCNIILLYCVTSVAIYLAVIPICHVFSVMLMFFALLGVHMGVIDTVANSLLIKIHGKKVS